MIKNLKQAKACYEQGRCWESVFRKVPAIASTHGVWSDLSGSPGNPRPNYYVGSELTSTLFNSGYGIPHGGNVAPYQKVLHKVLLGSSSAGHAPASYKILDYLMYYPLIDMDSTDEQVMIPTTTLPRYSDGVGVEAMLVAVNPYIGGANFYINYTCADDQPRQSQVEVSTTSTLISTIVHSAAPTSRGGGPFIRRAAGCRGIKKIDSITFLAPNGGLAALVLVKPLAAIMTNETTAYCEHDLIMERKMLPTIVDGAYINLIGCSGSNWAAAPLNGSFSFIWG